MPVLDCQRTASSDAPQKAGALITMIAVVGCSPVATDYDTAREPANRPPVVAHRRAHALPLVSTACPLRGIQCHCGLAPTYGRRRACSTRCRAGEGAVRATGWAASERPQAASVWVSRLRGRRAPSGRATTFSRVTSPPHVSGVDSALSALVMSIRDRSLIDSRLLVRTRRLTRSRCRRLRPSRVG